MCQARRSSPFHVRPFSAHGGGGGGDTSQGAQPPLKLQEACPVCLCPWLLPGGHVTEGQATRLCTPPRLPPPQPSGLSRARDPAPSWTETLESFKPQTLQTGQNQVSWGTGSWDTGDMVARMLQLGQNQVSGGLGPGIQVSMCQGYRGLYSSPSSATSCWMTVKHVHLSGPQWHHL